MVNLLEKVRDEILEIKQHRHFPSISNRIQPRKSFFEVLKLNKPESVPVVKPKKDQASVGIKKEEKLILQA